MWERLTYFAFSLPNRPGELARFTALLQAVGVNLVGLFGYAEDEESPRLSCVPTSPDKFRQFAASNGIDFEEGSTFYFEGEDRPGALVDSFMAIADAGINIDAIDSVGSGNTFGCFIWCAPEDWDALEKLLC